MREKSGYRVRVLLSAPEHAGRKGSGGNQFLESELLLDEIRGHIVVTDPRSR